MTEDHSASVTTTGHRDRSGRLIFGGVLLFLAGAGAILLGLARRSRIAWWVGLLTFVAWGVWSVVTLPRIDLDALLTEVKGMQPQMASDMAAALRDPRFFGSMVLIWLVMIGYFLYARRYLET